MERLNRLALGVAVLATVSSGAVAANRFWDTNNVGTDNTFGGDGTWSAADANWNDTGAVASPPSSGSLSAWNNANIDQAIFPRSFSGTVSVSGTVITSGLSLQGTTGTINSGTGSYTIQNGTIDLRTASFSFTINNTTGANTVNSGLLLFSGTAAATTNVQRFNIAGGSVTLGGSINDSSGTSGSGNRILRTESYTASATTFNGDFTKSAGSKGIQFEPGGTSTSNSASVVLNGAGAGLAGTITMGRGALVINNSSAVSGASGLVLNNPNTDAASADSVRLHIGTGGVAMSKSVTVNALTDNDTADVRQIGGTNASGTATFSGAITLGSVGASGVKVQLAAADGGTVEFSNTINDGSASVPINKVGNGTVRLTKSTGNTYDGGTTVSAGTLVVTNTGGSGTGTGSVVVNSTGTLGGGGFVDPGSGNTVTVNGKIAPGESVGTLTIGSTGSTNNVSFGATGQYLAEVVGNTKDLLAINGDVALAGTLDVTFSGTQTLSRYVLATYSGSRGGTEFATLAVHGSALSWQMDYSVPGEIAVAVPEPASLGLLGLAGLLLRRRR